MIHYILACSIAVERQFSGAGIVINECRTALDLDQVLFMFHGKYGRYLVVCYKNFVYIYLLSVIVYF